MSFHGHMSNHVREIFMTYRNVMEISLPPPFSLCIHMQYTCICTSKVRLKHGQPPSTNYWYKAMDENSRVT